MSRNPYESPEAARTCDEENAGRQDFDFYLELARELSPDGPGLSVLDIGAGTGALGVELAAAGHRVTGVDPALAMLDIARHRPGGEQVTWIHG
ncbi:MAG: class I SAM-dependent methyltransferase [Brachybacterium sp.]